MAEAGRDVVSVGLSDSEVGPKDGVDGLPGAMGAVSRETVGICCCNVSCCVGECVLEYEELGTRGRGGCCEGECWDSAGGGGGDCMMRETGDVLRKWKVGEASADDDSWAFKMKTRDEERGPERQVIRVIGVQVCAVGRDGWGKFLGESLEV